MTATSLISRRHRVGQVGIMVAALCLILLTWMGTYSAMEAERGAARSQVEADAYDQALAIGEKFSVQMRGYEQTVRVIEREWERDPDRFSLAEWRDAASVLSDPSLDLFITDAEGVVRTSTNPQLIGLDLGHREFFAEEAARADNDSRLGIDRSGRGLLADQWSITLVRRLNDREKGFRGIVGVSFHSASIADAYLSRDADRGPNTAGNGILILVGKSGRLRAVSGPLGAEPGQSIASSELYRVASAGEVHSWIGPTALDGVVRIHGFYRLPNRNLIVIVGYDRGEALRASDQWQRGAVVFAAGITLFLILIAALMLRDMREVRLREERMRRSRATLEGAFSELKVAKMQADAKSGQLEATFASMSDGVSLLDADLRLVQWNDRFCELIGLTPAELRIGLPFEDVLRRQVALGEFGPVEPEAEVTRRMALLVSHSGPVVTERVRPNGTIIELRRAPLPSGGFVTLYSDITARKQAEAAQNLARATAEAAAEEKSRFAAIVSHEIRTPLNMLLNSVDILARSGLSSKNRELVELAQQAGEALHDLLNDILELSKLEAGRLSLRPAWFELEALLAGVLDLFRSHAAARGTVLRLDIAADVPKRIHADPARLRQVLMNFVSNAVKFSEPGEVTLSARLAGSGAEQGLRIAVADPGPQIAESDRERLFQAFSRLDQPESQNKPGSGLGLAICRRLVALVGGDIGCSASDAGGNAFWLRLPVSRLTAGPPDDEAGSDPAPLPVLPRTRVLLVDDVLANRTITTMLLEHGGHTVDNAGSGTEAIAAALRSSYDVVLLDLFMPGMDGFETAARLRALEGRAGTTPILALTGTIDEGVRARCSASGMEDVLEKPVNPRALLEAIRRCVWGTPADGSHIAGEAASGLTGPVLCPDRLSLLRATMPEAALGQMFEACLADLIGKMPPLRSALAQGNRQAAARELHAMSGVAASYGLTALDASLRDLRAALGQGDEIDVDSLCAAIADDLARAGAAVRDVFASEPVA